MIMCIIRMQISQFLAKHAASLSSELKQHGDNVYINFKWGDSQEIEKFTCGGKFTICTSIFNKISLIVKTIKQNDRHIIVLAQEIEKEMVILSNLDHPNIITLHSSNQTL